MHHSYSSEESDSKIEILHQLSDWALSRGRGSAEPAKPSPVGSVLKCSHVIVVSSSLSDDLLLEAGELQ